MDRESRLTINAFRTGRQLGAMKLAILRFVAHVHSSRPSYRMMSQHIKRHERGGRNRPRRHNQHYTYCQCDECKRIDEWVDAYEYLRENGGLDG